MGVQSGGVSSLITSFESRYLSTGSTSITGTTEQSLISVGSGSMTIPANWVQAGSTARLVIRGLLTTPLVSLGTSTFRFKTNGTTRVTGQTVNLLGGMTNAGFVAYQTISFRSSGVSGTAVCAGELRYPSGSLIQQGTVDMIQPAPFTIDTTQAISLDLTAQWSLISHSMQTVTTTLELLSPTPM
jgi:hypothetical protein